MSADTKEFVFLYGSKKVMKIARDGTVKLFVDGEAEASPQIYYAIMQVFCPADVPGTAFQEWAHAKGLLKKLEWMDVDVVFGRVCPSCHNPQFKDGMPNSHDKDCELAILIGAKRE